MAVGKSLREFLSPSNERWRRAASTKAGCLNMRDFDLLVSARKKHCPRCSRWLAASIEVFGECRSKYDGLNSICKGCRRDYDRQRRQERQASDGQSLGDPAVPGGAGGTGAAVGPVAGGDGLLAGDQGG